MLVRFGFPVSSIDVRPRVPFKIVRSVMDVTAWKCWRHIGNVCWFLSDWNFRVVSGNGTEAVEMVQCTIPKTQKSIFTRPMIQTLLLGQFTKMPSEKNEIH